MEIRRTMTESSSCASAPSRALRDQRSFSDSGERLDLELKLHNAAKRGNASLLQRHFQGAPALGPDVPDHDGRTLLHSAVCGGSVDCVRLLLELGGNAHATDNDLDTPLHRAAYRGKAESIKLLLEEGVNVGSKNRAGRTAMDLAASKGHTHVVKLLKQHSSRASSRPVAPPSAPVCTKRCETALTVEWTEPEDPDDTERNLPVLSFVLLFGKRFVPTVFWAKLKVGAAETTSTTSHGARRHIHELTGLTRGTGYQLCVRAVNANGEGPASAKSAVFHTLSTEEIQQREAAAVGTAALRDERRMRSQRDFSSSFAAALLTKAGNGVADEGAWYDVLNDSGWAKDNRDGVGDDDDLDVSKIDSDVEQARTQALEDEEVRCGEASKILQDYFSRFVDGSAQLVADIAAEAPNDAAPSEHTTLLGVTQPIVSAECTPGICDVGSENTDRGGGGGKFKEKANQMLMETLADLREQSASLESRCLNAESEAASAAERALSAEGRCAAHAARADELERRLRACEMTVIDTQKKLDQCREERDTASKRVLAAESRVVSVASELQSAQVEIEALGQTIVAERQSADAKQHRLSAALAVRTEGEGIGYVEDTAAAKEAMDVLMSALHLERGRRRATAEQLRAAKSAAKERASRFRREIKAAVDEIVSLRARLDDLERPTSAQIVASNFQTERVASSFAAEAGGIDSGDNQNYQGRLPLNNDDGIDHAVVVNRNFDLVLDLVRSSYAERIERLDALIQHRRPTDTGQSNSSILSPNVEVATAVLSS